MSLKTTKFDVADYLKTPEEQALYLEAAIDEDDPSFIASPSAISCAPAASVTFHARRA